MMMLHMQPLLRIFTAMTAQAAATGPLVEEDHDPPQRRRHRSRTGAHRLVQ